MRRLWVLLAPCMLFATACSALTGPTKEQQVQIAVAETLSSLPRNTPVPLAGMFCEYQFCIGHPADMAFYDVGAAKNQTTPSSYGQGIIAAYKPDTGPVILVVWQEAPNVTDPQFMIDLILQDGGDTRNGSAQVQLIGPLNVFFVPVTPANASTSTVPYGEAAAWLCGGRAFAWKAYTAQQQLAASLMMDALTRFRCESR
jgi:hypothetical protein